MRAENIDLVRSIYADWERGDFSGSEWADPDIEFAYAGGPEPDTWTGPAGMAHGWREWLRDWVDFSAKPVTYMEVDDERILVLVRNVGRGKASGVEIEQRSVGNPFEISDGRVKRLVVYLDIERASADLGVKHDTGAPA
jgi:ketosteroid isomerase-like protein